MTEKLIETKTEMNFKTEISLHKAAPQIHLGVLGSAVSSPSGGFGAEARPQTHFWHILSLGNVSGGSNFSSYFTSHYPSENDNVQVK